MSTKVPAATLVEDFSFYPRNQIDDTHVSELVKALASGSDLPPVIADQATNRIVDGVHRRRAMVKFYGEDTMIDVEFRSYQDDAELYLDAVGLNAKHGRRLDRHDQTRIVLRLQELNVEPRIIASALHVPEQEVRTLSVRIVYDTGGTAVPQKRGLEHLRGRTLSDDQLSAMKSVRSAEAGRLCIELMKLLEHELVDYDDPNIRERLQQLAHAVTGALKRIRAADRTKQKAEMTTA